MRQLVFTAGRWLGSLFTMLLMAWAALAGYYTQACPVAADGFGWALLALVAWPLLEPGVGVLGFLLLGGLTAWLARAPVPAIWRVAVAAAGALVCFAVVWVLAGWSDATARCHFGF